MGLVRSHLADTLVSPHVDLIPDLFDSAHRGRAFALFRNPIDRAASLYYYLKETNYVPLEGKNLVEYAKSELSENNWLGESKKHFRHCLVYCTSCSYRQYI